MTSHWILLLILLISSSEQSEYQRISERNRNRNNSRFSRFLNCFSFCVRINEPVAVIHPEISNERSITLYDQTFEIDLNLNLNSDFNYLIILDPFNESEIARQFEVSKQRLFYGNGDRLSNICPRILSQITSYLDFNSKTQLRCVNRRLLVRQVVESREALYKSLSKKVKRNGFDCLHRSTFSATLLLELKKPLGYLSTRQLENTSKDQFDTLEQLIISTLLYYRHVDLVAFGELLEVVTKGKLLIMENDIKTLSMSINELLRFACQQKLIKLGMVLIKFNDPALTSFLFYDCCLVCISVNNFVMFKAILTEFPHFSKEKIFSLLNRSISNSKLEFIEFLFENFKFLT